MSPSYSTSLRHIVTSAAFSSSPLLSLPHNKSQHRHHRLSPLSSSSHSFSTSTSSLSRTSRLSFSSSSSTTVTCNVNAANNKNKPDNNAYLTVEQGRQLLNHAINLKNGNVHAVAVEAAIGFCQAFRECYDSEEYTRVFVVVGPGMNGLIGLHIAAKLSQLGYEPVVYAPYGNNNLLDDNHCTSISNVEEGKNNEKDDKDDTETVTTSKEKETETETETEKEQDVEKIVAATRQFCARHEISLYDFVPTTLSYYFDVVIDSLLGLNFDGGDIWPHFWTVYDMLITTDLPIASVDVPSGWDLTLGPRSIDITADTFIKPDLLVSLGAPKLCAKKFAGEFHFVAAKLVEDEWLLNRNVVLPPFLEDRSSVLFQSNSNAFGNLNGEAYGRPGQFNATLFTKNPRRKWVDPEEEDDLWDELD